MAEQILSFGPRTLEENELLEDSSPAREEDEFLLQGLRTGSESSYEELITRFQQPVYNLVFRLLRDPSEACDVVQEVFLKVFRKVGAFRGESSLKTWVYRIAVNEAHNQSRWNGRHRRQEVDLASAAEGGRSYRESLPAGGATPFEYALNREQHRLIGTALQNLNPSFREVVVLRDIEDLSYEEIAEVLGVPLGTVKSRILRGRDALRRELEKRLEAGNALPWAPQMGE